MIAEKMKGMVANSSAIRAMFEEGNRLAEIYGAENVYEMCIRDSARGDGRGAFHSNLQDRYASVCVTAEALCLEYLVYLNSGSYPTSFLLILPEDTGSCERSRLCQSFEASEEHPRIQEAYSRAG